MESKNETGINEEEFQEAVMKAVLQVEELSKTLERGRKVNLHFIVGASQVTITKVVGEKGWILRG